MAYTDIGVAFYALVQPGSFRCAWVCPCPAVMSLRSLAQIARGRAEVVVRCSACGYFFSR